MELSSLDIRLSRTENLPSISHVALEVLQKLDEKSVGLQELEELLVYDPALTGKILKVANSAAYGVGEVGSLTRAVQILGLANLKRLVIGVAFQQSIFEELDSHAFSKIEFWKHSYAVASLSKRLSQDLGIGNPDELFTAGMMHDMGHLVIERFAFAHCRASFALAMRDQMYIVDAEARVLGWSHTDAGASLARKWSLPKIVERAMQYHHAPGMDNECYSTTCLVSVADSLAYLAGFTNSMTFLPTEPDTVALLELNIDLEEKGPELMEYAVAEVIKAQEMFGVF